MGDVTNREAEISAEMAGWRLDRALAAAIPTLSRERLKALISSGAVTGPTGALLRDPATKAQPGVHIVAVPEPRPAHNVPQDIALEIVFEDDHLLVVDKPAGMVVHPAAGNLDGTLVNALLHHCAGRLSGIGGVARPGIVHRIDKDTSGLLVVAKTDRAHEGLAAQFAKHDIHRLYLAVVSGMPMPPAGKVDAALARSSADRKKMAVVIPPRVKPGGHMSQMLASAEAPGRGKRAVTHYRTIRPLKGGALVECRLETGRTHQVRVHMAHIGHPLVGDPVYGRTAPMHREVLKSLGFARQALHAAQLGFIHPVSKENLSFKSALPSDIEELLAALTV